MPTGLLVKTTGARLAVEPIGHTEIERLVKQAYATPKEVIARAKSFLKRSKKKKKK